MNEALDRLDSATQDADALLAECNRLKAERDEARGRLDAGRKECEQRLWGGADEIVRLVAANILNVLNGAVVERPAPISSIAGAMGLGKIRNEQ